MNSEPINPPSGNRGRGKGKKLSSAASNVAQAKLKLESEGKIESAPPSRVERGLNPDSGRPALTAIFPRSDGRGPHRLDLSFLLGFPNLQPMFTDAFLYWGANIEPITRMSCRGSLQQFFLKYLEPIWSNLLHPEDIDDEILTGFKDSLLNTTGGGSRALHPQSVCRALNHLRSTLSALSTGPWASLANRIAEKIPSGPAGAHQKTVPTSVLGLEELLSVLEAAEREVLAIEHRFANARILLAEGRARLLDPSRTTNNSRLDYGDFATCLAAVDESFPGVMPKLAALRSMNSTLGMAVQYLHGQSKIDCHLYPSSRDLVPFALLLAIATVFNPETILGLNWKDIDFNKDHAGAPAIEIVGSKRRAARDLVRLLDPDAALSAQLSLKHTLACLRDITARIRPHLAREYADSLFVYVPQSRNGVRTPMGFGRDEETRVQNKSSDLTWSSSLKSFIKDNKLCSFRLSNLRPSILALVQLIDGSLETARKVGNHGSPVTTWTHYTSGSVRARYRERIGQVILLRERWLQTHGVIDPRRLMPGQDRGAATPGFTCMDPLSSPRPNQHLGRLCKDYGGCPSCPMAAAHPGDPLCVGYYTALEMAIYRSQGTMSARTWIERWTPVLADLAALRTWISPEVLEASRKISIRLPNVG